MTITATFNDEKFFKDLVNIVQYSEGFLEGVEKGKSQFFKNFGYKVKEVLNSYIDSQAKVDPQKLHHVYEWYLTGSPDARLYDIHCHVKNGGLSFGYSFSQSKSIQNGSKEPFYNKAKIMEDGLPVMIKPRLASTLAFVVDGKEIFSKGEVIINHPGGETSQGGFQSIFDSFFNSYFSQAFLHVSGLKDYLSTPKTFSSNMNAGKKAGKQIGVEVGYNWIINAGGTQ
jgi:hypothetical protein